MEKTIFKNLSSINVNNKIEKKGSLDYLPWADAWTIVSNIYSDISYTVIKNVDGFNYHHDGRTAWVETEVTINDKTLPEQLAITDNRNYALQLEKITSVDVNKTIKRCIVKNIALHGLGLYLWTKEDFKGPENKSYDLEKAKRENMAKLPSLMPKELKPNELAAALSKIDFAKRAIKAGVGSPEQRLKIKQKFNI